MGIAERNRLVGDLISIAAIVALLGAVYLLPPDTSLARVREAGVLRACVPDEQPPLVTRSDDQPGIDVEILRLVALELDLRLSLVTNSSIGRDFNPRNWRVTRAQCEVIGGGVVASDTTRSFLETTPPHAETGWAIVIPGELDSLQGTRVAFFAGVTGLDRIALSRFLRSTGADVAPVRDSDALVSSIDSGDVDAGITEALRARTLAHDGIWSVQWLPEELGRFDVAFGLWKGDLSLKRAVSGAIRRLLERGDISRIISEYELASIDDACEPCP